MNKEKLAIRYIAVTSCSKLLLETCVFVTGNMETLRFSCNPMCPVVLDRFSLHERLDREGSLLGFEKKKICSVSPAPSIVMATDMDRAYCEWSHDEIPSRSDSREVSVTQILDQGSISFGRFSVDSLSWEKWSVFPHNRRLEEVEKFKIPGLVAQKKAYFEAYYKRIRELKALQDQQSETELDYEGNGIVHSQTSEEHDSMREENAICKTAIITNQKILPEENAAEVSNGLETSNDALLLQNLEVETTVSYPDSSRRSIDDVIIEEIEDHRNEWKTIDIEDISTHKECSITIVEVVTSAQGTLREEMGSIQGRDLSYESTGSRSSSRVESNMKRRKHALSSPKSKGAAASLENPRGLKPNYTHKEATATSAKSNQKLERNTKADVVKSLQVPKFPPHRPAGKVETGVNSNKSTSSSKKLTSSNSSKASSNIVSNISKFTNGSISSKATSKKGPGGGTFTSISSDRPIAEVRSKVTVPRPFSFSTERRPVAPAHAGEVTHACSGSKSSNRLSLTHNSMMDIGVTRGMKSTGPAVRRPSHISAASKSNYSGGNESSHRCDDRNKVKAGSSLKQYRPSSKLLPSVSTSSRTPVTKPDNNRKITICMQCDEAGMTFLLGGMQESESTLAMKLGGGGNFHRCHHQTTKCDFGAKMEPFAILYFGHCETWIAQVPASIPNGLYPDQDITINTHAHQMGHGNLRGSANQPTSTGERRRFHYSSEKIHQRNTTQALCHNRTPQRGCPSLSLSISLLQAAAPNPPEKWTLVAAPERWTLDITRGGADVGGGGCGSVNSPPPHPSDILQLARTINFHAAPVLGTAAPPAQHPLHHAAPVLRHNLA
ncbi:hypothetical protein ACLOJK_016937 [Asimina triloba]